MRKRLSMILASAVVLVACGGPGPGNFEKYAVNENGVKQLKSYVQDESNAMENRLEAMNVLISAGWAMQTRGILQGCRDRDELALRLTDSLVGRLPGLTGDRSKLAPVRDAAFIALGQVPGDKRGPFQKRLAAWAFDGLGPGSSAEEVKKVVEPRVLVNQIADLGPAGVDGAILMIEKGFAVDKLANFVVGLKDKVAGDKLVAAFKKLHGIPDVVVKFTHIDALGKVHTPGAVMHLLDLALDEEQDPDVRAAAFNAATATLEDPTRFEGDRSGVLKRLRKMLGREDPDDRWSAARYVVKMEGLGAMDEVMGALKDDGIYPRANEDPLKTMVDFCRQVVFADGPSEASWKVVRGLLQSRNKVHRSLGVVCVKTTGERADLLSRLVRSRTGLMNVLGEKITLGRLAKNAMQGIAMMNGVDVDLKDGKVTAAQAKKKKFLILVNLLDTGEEYVQAVDRRFRKE